MAGDKWVLSCPKCGRSDAVEYYVKYSNLTERLCVFASCDSCGKSSERYIPLCELVNPEWVKEVDEWQN